MFATVILVSDVDGKAKSSASILISRLTDVSATAGQKTTNGSWAHLA